MKALLTFLLLFGYTGALAQMENQRWFFPPNYNTALKFTSNSVQPYDVTTMGYPSCVQTASISDKNTGELLFVANGEDVLDRNLQRMPGSTEDYICTGTLIVPHPLDSLRYYVFYTRGTNDIRYLEVDLSLRGGLGDVINSSKLLRGNAIASFAVVRRLYEDGFWLITKTIGSNEFRVFAVSGDSVYTSPVISFAGGMASQVLLNGGMVSNKTGSLLVHAYQTLAGASVDILYFDKRCGMLALEKNFYFETSTSSAAFSPTAKYVYMAFKDMVADKGEYYRYEVGSGNAPEHILTLAGRGFLNVGCGLALAPDNKIYLMDVVDAVNTLSQFTDTEGPSPQFNKDVVVVRCVGGLVLCRFPIFIEDTSDYLPGFDVPQIETKGYCIGDSTYITVRGDFQFDSIYLDPGTGIFYPGKQASLILPGGNATIVLKWYLCGSEYIKKKQIPISYAPELDLGPDTILCQGVRYQVTAEIGMDKYEWSTGENEYFITVSKPGIYSLIATNGKCQSFSKVKIDYFRPLWVELGMEHYVCEEDTTIVILDAGKGFKEYLWSPTGDTSRWLIVSQQGDYFVLVKDYRGCTGTDDTKVERRCPAAFEIPDAFTPNGDGKNDVFMPYFENVVGYHLRVYNRWGELVFNSTDPSLGWDGSFYGKQVPEGVYFYTISYSGSRNLRIEKNNLKGTVTVLR